MQSAIKEVLSNAVLASNITSAQSKDISAQLTEALVKVKNDNKTSNTTARRNETSPLGSSQKKLQSSRDNVMLAKNPGCADSMSACQRFKDAGICPFVAAFMNGACAKTCKTCPSHVKTSK